MSSTNSLHSATSDVSRTSIDAAFQQLATTLHEGFNLPKPELLTFNGTPTDYCKFIKNFETNIEGRVSDYRLRLNYLTMHIRSKWADVAHSIKEPRTGTPVREPRFSDLSNFVFEISCVASSMYGLDLAREKVTLRARGLLSVSTKIMRKRPRS